MDYKSLVEKIESEIGELNAAYQGCGDCCLGFRDGLGEVSRLIAQAREGGRHE